MNTSISRQRLPADRNSQFFLEWDPPLYHQPSVLNQSLVVFNLFCFLLFKHVPLSTYVENIVLLCFLVWNIIIFFIINGIILKHITISSLSRHSPFLGDRFKIKCLTKYIGVYIIIMNPKNEVSTSNSLSNEYRILMMHSCNF